VTGTVGHWRRPCRQRRAPNRAGTSPTRSVRGRDGHEQRPLRGTGFQPVKSRPRWPCHSPATNNTLSVRTIARTWIGTGFAHCAVPSPRLTANSRYAPSCSWFDQWTCLRPSTPTTRVQPYNPLCTVVATFGRGRKID
jgi:hypothetical protein